MKLITILLSAFSLTHAWASVDTSTAYTYQCDCIDTGMECDGSESMTLIIEGTTANISLGETDGSNARKFTANLDSTYKPEKNKDYDRYITAPSDRTNPYFLISKSLSAGKKKGSVKEPEVGKTGFGFEWYYECKAAKPARL